MGRGLRSSAGAAGEHACSRHAVRSSRGKASVQVNCGSAHHNIQPVPHQLVVPLQAGSTGRQSSSPISPGLDDRRAADTSCSRAPTSCISGHLQLQAASAHGTSTISAASASSGSSDVMRCRVHFTPTCRPLLALLLPLLLPPLLLPLLPAAAAILEQASDVARLAPAAASYTAAALRPLLVGAALGEPGGEAITVPAMAGTLGGWPPADAPFPDPTAGAATAAAAPSVPFAAGAGAGAAGGAPAAGVRVMSICVSS